MAGGFAWLAGAQPQAFVAVRPIFGQAEEQEFAGNDWDFAGFEPLVGFARGNGEAAKHSGSRAARSRRKMLSAAGGLRLHLGFVFQSSPPTLPSHETRPASLSPSCFLFRCLQ
jgi:hypothetical protein